MKAQNLTSDLFVLSLSDLDVLYGFTNAFDTIGVCHREKKNSAQRNLQEQLHHHLDVSVWWQV